MEATTEDITLATELRTVLSRLIKKLRNKSVASGGLSLTERSTMALLDQYKQLLPNEMAAMEKITTQSMSQVLNHLAELGYINRKPSPNDGRKIIVSLSKAGQDVLYKARNERDEWLGRAIAETCTAKEQELLRRVMVPLAKLVDYE